MTDNLPDPVRKLSKEGFFIAANGALARTVLRQWINMLEGSIEVDAEGNLLPKSIGALYLMLHSSLGTEFVHPSARPAIRSLKKFLDPYLEERYRPGTDEPPPVLYHGEYIKK